MDKLQMTVTLSDDSAPELLAYLRQIPGARERSIMLRSLAQRGLQMVMSAGPDVLMQPCASPGMPSPPLSSRVNPSPLHDMPAATTQVKSITSPSPTPAMTPTQGPVAAAVSMADASGTDQADPLAGIDVAALNDALARY